MPPTLHRQLLGAPEFLEVSGTPFEAGRRHGEQWGHLVRYVWRCVRRSLFAKSDLELRRALRTVSRDTARRFPDEVQEMEGIARGAGLDYRHVFLISRYPQLRACTAVVWAQARGGPLLAGNIDAEPLFAVKHSCIDGQYRYLISALPGTLGGGNGINEHGLAIACTSAIPTFRGYGPRPRYLTDYFSASARVLRTCKTVPQAIAFLQRPEIGGHGNHLLMDTNGDAACIEKCSQAFLSVRYPDANGYLFAVNNFLSEFNTPARRKHLDSFVPNQDRYQVLTTKGARGCRQGPRELKALMADRTVRLPGGYPICNAKAGALSTLAIPQRRELWVCEAPPHLARYVKYRP